jgi:hypothetical protein
MGEFFQQFLNRARRGYGQLDKNIFGGLLPGGAASPLAPVKKTVQKIVSPQNVRDFAVIPLLDTAMEAGVVPASTGMFGRYLTGTNKPLTKAPADIREAESWRAQGMSNPNSYIADNKTIDVYHGETNPFPREAALVNSLGRYVKQNGVVIDRYDFNEYNKSGIFSSGGVEGGDYNLEKTVDYIGNLASKFGLIKPGSGYDVRLNLPYQTKPELQTYKKISQDLSQRLNKENENLTPETIKLFQQHKQLEEKLKNKGIRLGLN